MQGVFKKGPRNFIISFFKVNFKDHTLFLAYFRLKCVQNFLGYHNVIIGGSPKDETGAFI